jgi:hypothetical protein
VLASSAQTGKRPLDPRQRLHPGRPGSGCSTSVTPAFAHAAEILLEIA